MTEATANLASNTPSKPSAAVKIAIPGLIIIEDAVTPPEIMFDLIFEDIGGREMINIARHCQWARRCLSGNQEPS